MSAKYVYDMGEEQKSIKGCQLQLCLDLSKDYEVILKSANNQFLSQFHLKEEAIGKKISTIFDSSIARCITEKYFFYRAKREEISYLFTREKAFHSQETIVWRYKIRFVKDTAICMATILDYPTEEKFKNYEYTNFCTQNYTNYFIITVQKQQNGYYITSDDDFLLSIYHRKTLIGENLNIIHFLKQKSDSYQVLDGCISSQRIIHYVDNISTHTGKYYYRVELIPSRSNKNELQLLYLFLQHTDYEREKFKLYSPFTFLPTCSLHATCTIKKHHGAGYHFDNTNQHCLRLLEEFNLNFYDLIKTNEFKLTKDRNIFTQATYQLKNIQGMLVPVNISYLPLDIGEHYYKVLVVATIPENHLVCNHVENILTKRELQIATLVAQNKTNKYIAFKLEISEGTVKRINYNIFQKLGISSRVELTKILYHCAEE